MTICIFLHFVALTYYQDTWNSFFATQSQTGTVRLVQSLLGTTYTAFNITIHASDGKLTSDAFTLTIHVTDRNQVPPKFDQSEYRVNVSESTSVGTTVLRVSATDEAVTMLYFVITAGNQQQTFSIDIASGNYLIISYNIGTSVQHFVYCLL